MQRHRAAVAGLRDVPSTCPEPRWTARAVLSRLAVVALAVTSVFGLGGCRAVAGIFKAGVWSGVVIVVVILAIGGGIAAAVIKRG